MWNEHGAFLANDNQYGDMGGGRQILALSQIVINPSIIKMSSCGFIIYIHTTVHLPYGYPANRCP